MHAATDIAFGIIVLGLVTMAIAVFRDDTDYAQRTFWIGAAIVTATSFAMGISRSWSEGVGLTAFAAGCIWFIAYIHTRFITIRGRTWAFYSDRTQPYGAGVTTPKAWWQLLLAVAIFMYPVFAFATGRGGPGQTAVSAGVAIAAGISFGYRDRFLHNPIAAGQRIQFDLVSLITLGVFLICYLGAYHASRRFISKTEAYGRHSRRRT